MKCVRSEAGATRQWWSHKLEKQNKTTTTEESLLAQRFFQIYFTIAFRGNFANNYHINYS